MGEWKVLFDTNFWGSAGEDHPAYEAGQEVNGLACTVEHPVGQTINWCGNIWKILSCYTCSDGMVIDYCKKIDPEELAAFVKKFREAGLEDDFNEELFEKLQLDNPSEPYADMDVYRGNVQLVSHGCSCLPYYPPSIAEEENDPLSMECMAHYGLGTDTAYMFCRSNFLWDEGHEGDLSGLAVVFREQEVSVPGEHFTLTGDKQDIPLTNPVTGKNFILHIESIEAQEFPQERFSQLNDGKEMIYPTHFETISYCTEPELSSDSFYLKACAKGDSPVMKDGNKEAAAIAIIGGSGGPASIIGGSNGPTSVFVMGKNISEHRLRSVCSPLFFAPTPVREWYICYRMKRREDLAVDLIV